MPNNGPMELESGKTSFRSSLIRKETKVEHMFDTDRRNKKNFKKDSEKKPIYLSLVSQIKNKIMIEILYDLNFENKGPKNKPVTHQRASSMVLI